MTEEEFTEVARRDGYGPPAPVSFDPNAKRESHSHDETLLVFVRRGVFILNTDDGADSFAPGQTCLVEKGVRHAEEAGPDGAEILIVRR